MERSLSSLKTQTQRQRYLRVRAKQHAISNALNDSFHKAVGKPNARIIFTNEFYYNNPHRAVLHGIPWDLVNKPPSLYTGGEARLDAVLDHIHADKVFYTVLTEEGFALRRKYAIESGCYSPPNARQQRSDKGGLHYRSKRLLWGKVPPVSPAIVTDQFEEEALANGAMKINLLRRSIRLTIKARRIERDAQAKYTWRRR